MEQHIGRKGSAGTFDPKNRSRYKQPNLEPFPGDTPENANSKPPQSSHNKAIILVS